MKAPKYALYIDYCAGIFPTVEYLDLQSNCLADAMQEAQKIRMEKCEAGYPAYFMQIMTRTTSTCERVEKGITAHEYKATIECWSGGWWPAAHTHGATRYLNKYDHWYLISTAW